MLKGLPGISSLLGPGIQRLLGCRRSGQRSSPTFVCPRCRSVSHHPDDVEQGYCGFCHQRTGGEGGRPAEHPRRRRGDRANGRGAGGPAG